MLLRKLLVATTALYGFPAAAQTVSHVTVSAQCVGQSNAQVALKWGHPTRDLDTYLPASDEKGIFTTPCGTPQPVVRKFDVLDPESQIEIQTEGGTSTAYQVDVTMTGKNGTVDNSFSIADDGANEVVSSGLGFALQRSSGPNKYGEQNFRVALADNKPVNVKVVAQSNGDRSNAQLAMRWGHPDFNNAKEFDLWTVKAGPAQTKTFTLAHQKSEFEIQTEGGTGTGYTVSIWFDTGSGFPMQPSIKLKHIVPLRTFLTNLTDVTVKPSRGNIYGEMNINVNAGWIPVRMPPAIAGLNVVYSNGVAPDFTGQPYSVPVEFDGTWIANSAAVVAGTAQNFRHQGSVLINPGRENETTYATSDISAGLQPGSWSVTAKPDNGSITKPCPVLVTPGSPRTILLRPFPASCVVY